VQVYWLQQGERDVPPDDAWLSAGEAARLAGMRFPKRRTDWRLGRWTAKRALAAYLGIAGQRIEIRTAASGAPEAFVSGEPAPAAISLSHRGGSALCAVAPAGAALGCDLELVEPRSAAFAADYFTAEEQALVAGVPAADRMRLITLIWSAKESGLKALREGLRLDTREIAVFPQLSGGEAWLPLECHSAGRRFQGWWQPDGMLVRTLVADPPPDAPIALW
jgi:4'-phosphopantetheinyl transferase